MQTSETVELSAGPFQPVIEQCEGCDRIVEQNTIRYCKTYVNPTAKWRLGMCNFATHAKPEIKIVKVRINPLKAAKRASSSRRG